MRIMILGGGGMLGHKVYQILSKKFDTFATFRDFTLRLKETNIFNEEKVISKVDAFKIETIKEAISRVEPDYVINCIGIIKQLKEAHDYKTSIYINSLFPHLLADYCTSINSKLIHISTDCVFSGKKGDYLEKDLSDAEDLYGKTKYLGEITYGNHITFRTSIIGRELFSNISLVDWFLSQNGKTVNGYVNAIYTGLTNNALSNEIERIISEFPKLTGLYHVSSEKIDKYQLLCLIKDIYGLKIDIKPYNGFYCNRSLNSIEYRKLTNFKPPSWKEMIVEMQKDKTWRCHGG